ncbi:hypothetical protein HanOQP8_Chr02g0045811 [Helianthus annuus]|nr:hypothetical protein HanOQP8_Chr02g0045811 [Helianthus annuus]
MIFRPLIVAVSIYHLYEVVRLLCSLISKGGKSRGAKQVVFTDWRLQPDMNPKYSLVDPNTTRFDFDFFNIPYIYSKVYDE